MYNVQVKIKVIIIIIIIIIITITTYLYDLRWCGGIMQVKVNIFNVVRLNVKIEALNCRKN